MSDDGLLGMEQAVRAAMAENNAVREMEVDTMEKLEQFGNRAASLMMQLMPVVNDLDQLRQDWSGIVEETVEAERRARPVPQSYLGALTGANSEVLLGVSNGLATAQNKQNEAVAATLPVTEGLKSLQNYLSAAVRLLDSSIPGGGQIISGEDGIHTLLEESVESREAADRVARGYMRRILGR